MKIFVVPSWYPSESNPIYGTFNHEQALLLGKQRPTWEIGVSRWGQGDARFLLWSKEIRSLFKRTKKYVPFERKIASNVTEYFFPAFTWSRLILKGNIRGIIRANEYNFKKFLSANKDEVVISAQASYPASVVASFLSKKYDIPYMVTIRMSPFPFPEFLEKRGKVQDIIAKPLLSAHRLIATSSSLQSRMYQLGFKNVDVLHNPIDSTLFQLSKQDKNNNSILTIGRMEHQKGIDILLNMLVLLPQEFPYQFRIAGGGRFLKQYKALAAELQVADKVVWLGELSREQIAHEIKECIFYLMTSRHETFGNVLLEAMASGKPLVATNCGGPSDIVSPEVGYLTEINPQGLAMSVLMMSEDLHLFDPQTIRGEALKRFSEERWAQKIEKIFREIV